MDSLLLHPACIVLLGALLTLCSGKNYALIPALATPALAGLAIFAHVQNPVQMGIDIDMFDMTFQLYHVHEFSHVFALTFCVMATAGMVYAAGYAKLRLRFTRTEMLSSLLYLAAGVGVCYAGDWLTLLLWWELMAIAATMIILCGDTVAARGAAYRYALMHVFAGMILFAGICMAGVEGELTSIRALTTPLQHAIHLLAHAPATLTMPDVGVLCMLAGVLINVAMPPFSAWVADAYPEASPSGAVFLSAITTKAAVFVLALMAPGLGILVWLGLVMAWYGVVYSIREDIVRKVMAYSILTQVGVMVTAIGIGSDLALAGVAAHAGVHILYKAVLFTSIGNVIVMTGRHQLSELGGLARSMPFTATCAVIGALTLAAMPLTAAFETKSMIFSAAANDVYLPVWFGLLAIGATSVIQAAVVWQIFFHRDSGLRPKEPTFGMRAGTLMVTVALVLLSLNPTWFLAETIYNAYTTEHITAQIQLVSTSLIIYFLALYHTKLLRRKPNILKDFDWFYRHFANNLWQLCERMVALFWRGFVKICQSIQAAVQVYGERIFKSEVRAVGVTASYVLSLLALGIVLYWMVHHG